MKKLVYIAAAFAAILACSKESQEPQGPQDTNSDNTPEEVVDESKTVHELFVSLPDFTDAETKAIIDDATGSFSWTVGDKIAVVDDQNNVYPFVASESAQSVRFTYVGSIAGSLKSIYYPYIEESPYYITEMPTNLDSETAVLTSSNIRMSGTIEGNSATLSHNHAFVRLKFENVPSFATKIQLYESGNETPTEVTLTGTGAVTAYLPVHDGTQAITASLLDDNDNVIIQKYHNFGEEKAFVKGSIKNMKALTVGHVFTFKNDAGWVAPTVSIWNGSESFGFKSVASEPTAEYPWKLNLLGNNTYYIVINDDVKNVNNHVFANDLYLGVWFGNDSSGSLTDCVYVYRDIDFTIPLSGGLKTDYRTYFYLQSDNSRKWWGGTTKIIVSGGTTGNGTFDMTKLGDYLFYYSNHTDNYARTMTYGFNNGNGWVATTSWEYVLNREYQYDFNG